MIYSKKCSLCEKEFFYFFVDIEPFEKDNVVIRCPYCDEIADMCKTSGFVHSYKTEEDIRLKLNKQ
jgi:DNA-directed RNA polymerase subunit RPC12/RpoP